MASEEDRTIVVEIDLPPGVDSQLYQDLNMVALRRGMTRAQQERALDELQARWRRSLVFDGPAPPLTVVA